jgi:hypothetical protein
MIERFAWMSTAAGWLQRFHVRTPPENTKGLPLPDWEELEGLLDRERAVEAEAGGKVARRAPSAAGQDPLPGR